MNGIVLELQKEAMDKNADIESLLRKSYVIARKLKLPEFQEWIQCEQEGYGGKETPEYRMIQGQLKALNPVRGWIPVVMESAIAEKAFTKTKLPNSVSELYDLYQNAENSMLVMNLPAEMNKYVAKCCGFNTQFRLEFGKNQVYSILSRVKNNILDWALTLEESGIVGRDYSFSEEEKKIAQEKTEITNYITNFWGTTTDVQMQQGNVDSLQDK
jgi:hypothetical protein